LCVAIASVVQDEEVVEWSEASTLISIIMVLKKKSKMICYLEKKILLASPKILACIPPL
jgi:hypothetical protein